MTASADRQRLSKLSDVRPLVFKNFVDHRGSLVPIEGGADVPFDIRRLFYVRPSAANLTRGQHGHFQCSQVLICVAGSCRVTVQDGLDKAEYRLDSHDQGLLIPPGIWAEEFYETNDTVLIVLCDHLFNKDDYIDKYDDFLKFRGLVAGD